MLYIDIDLKKLFNKTFYRFAKSFLFLEILAIQTFLALILLHQ